MQSTLASTINRLSKAQLQCGSCGTSEEALPSGQHFQRCAGCHMQRYCSRECQVAHWKQHKPICKQNQDTQNRMTEEHTSGEKAANVSPTDINAAMSTFITKNRALLDHLAINNSDLYPLPKGNNKPKQFPVVSMTVSRPPEGALRIKVQSVEVVPVAEMLELQPSLQAMFENMEMQSKEKKGCAGFTTVILMAGPVARPLPVLLNDDLRNTDPSLFAPVMSMKEWTDTLNKVV